MLIYYLIIKESFKSNLIKSKPQLVIRSRLKQQNQPFDLANETMYFWHSYMKQYKVKIWTRILPWHTFKTIIRLFNTYATYFRHCKISKKFHTSTARQPRWLPYIRLLRTADHEDIFLTNAIRWHDGERYVVSASSSQ